MNFKFAVMAAAVLGAASTAQAADLAKKAPAAANYVKVCDAYGAGFFYIPGSETCLKIGGYVYAQYNVWSVKGNFWGGAAGFPYGSGRARNAVATGARMNIQFDARTATEMGMLRSYIELQETIGSQPFTNGTNGNGSLNLEKGFIQFAGLTAGRANSFFDFYTGDHLSSIFETAHSDSIVNLIAYTFSLGNGITASVSIEDPTTGNGGGRRWAPGANVPGQSPYAGVKHPDYVANLNVTQAWGSAQLMAALHQDYSMAAAPVGGADASKMGWAIGAGAKINLPMLGASDVFGIQAAYSKGAISYVSPDWYTGSDFFTAAGKIEQTTAWSVAAGLTHGWTKTLSSSLTGSYAKYDEATAFGIDYRQIDVGGNLAWAPVTGLTMTTEVEYKNVNFSNDALAARSGLADTHALVGFLRIRRDF